MFASAKSERMPVKDLLLHLRLHWQVMLAPLFLWGFVLAAGARAPELITAQFWLVFFIFHVLFYGGATALNSYYDQDEGPVGGLWNPPQVTRDLLVFSVSLQVIGLLLLFFISLPLFGLALIMGAVGNAYSHPAIRLKARPWTSLLAVSIFQGMGGTAAGWLFAAEQWQTLFSLQAMLAILTASLIITGFYPLTQIYQREQDQKQGVISFAVYAGEKCFPLAIACMLSAAGLMSTLAWRYFGPLEALAAAAGLVGLAVYVALWWRRYDESQVRVNYLWMMRLGYLMTGGFLGFVGWLLVRGLWLTST
jgi:1,4-dihydroxy-2-naphthoate octaprenyltransferase